MAKKKQMGNENAPWHYCKGCYSLIGVAFIILGVMLYINLLSLEQTAAIALVVFGIKKIYVAARCC